AQSLKHICQLTVPRGYCFVHSFLQWLRHRSSAPAFALLAGENAAKKTPATPIPKFLRAPRRVTDWARPLVSSPHFSFIILPLIRRLFGFHPVLPETGSRITTKIGVFGPLECKWSSRSNPAHEDAVRGVAMGLARSAYEVTLLELPSC